MNINNLPAFPHKKLSREQYKDLSKRVDEAQIKWDRLRKKYPNKTTREILKCESNSIKG